MFKIKAWISAARLRTLPLSISGIVTASAAAIGVNSFSMLIFVLALATTLGFQILSNFANDYGDGVKGTDNADRVGPTRTLQSGRLTAKELKTGMIVTAFITLLMASMLIFVAFGTENFITSLVFFNLGILSIIAAITYTVGKKAYGYRALGDIFVFIFFGALGVIGGYYLYTLEIKDLILLPAITIGLLSTAVLNLNNMRDRMTDATMNKITMAVLLGGKAVKLYHSSLIILAFLSALSYFMLKAEDIMEFIPLLAFIPLFNNLITVLRNDTPSLLDPELKKVALSTFLFSVLFFASNFF
jgi:1,4-dihydroxy-2-naphthoate polyprenyltransferase